MLIEKSNDIPQSSQNFQSYIFVNMADNRVNDTASESLICTELYPDICRSLHIPDNR